MLTHNQAQSMPKERPKIISRILVVIVCIISAILISLVDLKTTVNSLTIELMSDQARSFRLYYNTGSGYNEQESVDSEVLRRDKQTTTYHFSIPSNKTLVAIRIDPDEQPAKYLIKTVSVNYLSDFKRVYPHLTWNAGQIEKLFVPLHNVKSFILQDGYLLVEAEGPDPYFGTKENLSETWARLRNERHPFLLPLKIGGYLLLAIVAILFFFLNRASMNMIRKIVATSRQYVYTLPFLLIVFIITMVSTYHQSSTYDEPEHYIFGENALAGRLHEADVQRMPVTALNVLPVDLLEKAGVKLTDSEKLFVGRIPTALASVVLALFVFVWSARLYGLTGGLFSLILYTFCPTIIAHSGLVTTDVYCACAMFISVYFFVKYLNNDVSPHLQTQDIPLSCHNRDFLPGILHSNHEQDGSATNTLGDYNRFTNARMHPIKNGSLKYLLLAACASGVAQVTKHTALLLFPIFIIILLFHMYKSAAPHGGWCFHAKRRVLDAIIFLAIVWLIINSSYCFNGTFMRAGDYINKSMEWSQKADSPSVYMGLSQRLGARFPFVPVPFPKAYVGAFDIGMYINATGQVHGPIYLMGKLSTTGWWYYFPIAAFLKFPLAFFALLLVSFAVSGRFIASKLDEFALAVSSVVLALFFGFFCTAQIGVRYLIPILPFVYVFIGKAVEYRPGKYVRLYKCACSLLAAWFVVSSTTFFPHYISYFNELTGNRSNLYKWLADSNLDWGQNNYYLAEYLKKHRGEKISVEPLKPVDGTVIVAVNKLVGITVSQDRYKWLRDNYEPSGNIAYSWLVYHVPVEAKK